MFLLHSEWFMDCAAACVWQDEGGEEDVLAQAGKVRGRKVNRSDDGSTEQSV